MSGSYQYCACISGAIGVGKSTVYRALCQALTELYGDSFMPIREYIDAEGIKETSNFLLREYLNGKISDACFQNYIQSYYINELTDKKVEGKIIIMERSMSDSVAIFCNAANRRNVFSDIDLAIMYQNCIKSDMVYGFPNYFEKNFEFTYITTKEEKQTFEAIKAIIEDDIRRGIKNRVFGLINAPEVCFERVCKRNRNSESSYTFESIKGNVESYDRLFKLLSNPVISKIRLTDFGYIIHDY